MPNAKYKSRIAYELQEGRNGVKILKGSNFPGGGKHFG